MESYEFVKVYDGNTWAFRVDSNIRSHMNVIYECADVSHGCFCTLAFGHSVFTCAIVVKHTIHARD